MSATKNHRDNHARLLATLLLGLAAMFGTATATALPPDGAGPDTPGTSSRVWPAQVSVGDRLNFEVSGYPANETVYIKIDDGLMCSDTSHGACVFATQRLDSNGYASGSIIVPDMPAGDHWLRMLATGDVFDSETGEKLGYEGYTRRGGNDFTVVAASSGGSDSGGSSNSGSTDGSNSSGTTGGGSDSPAPGSTQPAGTQTVGTTVELSVDEDEAGTEETSPDATEAPAAVAGEEDEADPGSSVSSPTTVDEAAAGVPEALPETAPGQQGSGLPVVGIASLAGAVLLGGSGLAWALVRRNRLATAAATAATASADHEPDPGE